MKKLMGVRRRTDNNDILTDKVNDLENAVFGSDSNSGIRDTVATLKTEMSFLKALGVATLSVSGSLVVAFIIALVTKAFH